MRTIQLTELVCRFWTFVKKLWFAYRFGHFDSLGVCQKIVRTVGFVGLPREDEENKSKTKMRACLECLALGGDIVRSCAVVVNSGAGMSKSRATFSINCWGSYLLQRVTLGYYSPESMAWTIYFTSLLARMGTSFTSLIPGWALLLLPCSQEGHLFYFPDPRKGTYFTSLFPGRTLILLPCFQEGHFFYFPVPRKRGACGPSRTLRLMGWQDPQLTHWGTMLLLDGEDVLIRI